MSVGAPLLPARSAYLEQVRRIAPPDPPGLRDRDEELAELARFCLNPDGPQYAWWRAGPWAGKSALLSTFVLRPPAELAGRAWTISFFITARLAAQDTREAFTDVLLEQLAALLGESLPAVLPEARREACLLDLMSQAAAECQDAGGRLVLVVDGLDEDHGVTGPEAHSIAGLLPASPPAGMRVIVAGRPNPPVPDDVPDWHPLRDPAIIRRLNASPHARNIQRLAGQELRRLLLHGSPAEQDLLGLLAAARGGLSAWDLAELAGIPRWEATDILRTASGRAYSSRPSRLGPTTRADVYLLAHEELQAEAVEYFGDRLAGYCERLHSWAARHRACKWPTGTPEYLLAGYFQLLEDLDDLPRMTECALDLHRHDAMLDLTGGDGAAIAETRTALDRIAAQDEPDLADALALACHRDYLTDRNSKIPVRLPAVWAALGQLSRAKSLAASLPYPELQAKALAEVAEALASRGHLQQAVALAAQADGVARSIPEPGWREFTLADIAGALARAGQFQQAETNARSVTDPTSANSQIRALAEVAQALAAAGHVQRARALAMEAETIARTTANQDSAANALAEAARALAAAGQLQQAEMIARTTSSPYWQVIALAKVAKALAAAGKLPHAEALAAQAEMIARSIDDRGLQVMALPSVVEALAAVGQPHQAAALAAQAGAIARTLPGRGSHTDAMVEVVGALARAGQFQQAETIARTITGQDSESKALTEIAGALAAAGQLQQAKGLATQAEATARSIIDPDAQMSALAEVVGALAGAGQFQQAERIARTIRSPGSQAKALAEVAGALAAAGQLQQAKVLAMQAEAHARSIADPFFQANALITIVGALARSGQIAEADVAARSIVDPDAQVSALAEIASALAAAGQLQQAKVSAVHAKTIALSSYDPTSDDPTVQVSTLAQAAGALAATGQLQQAVTIAVQAEATARSVTDPDSLVPALAYAAVALASAGKLRQAEAIADSIKNSEWKSWALVAVVKTLTRAGQLQQAEATARCVPDSYLQADALAQIATSLAQAGDAHSASRVAAATCAVGPWTTAVRPVLLLMPSAFIPLTRSLKAQDRSNSLSSLPMPEEFLERQGSSTHPDHQICRIAARILVLSQWPRRSADSAERVRGVCPFTGLGKTRDSGGRRLDAGSWPQPFLKPRSSRR